MLLKDNVEGLGYAYAAVEITDQQWILSRTIL